MFKGSEFYDRSIKSWLQDKYIEIYSTINEGKSVVAERFISLKEQKLQVYDFNIKRYIYILTN